MARPLRSVPVPVPVDTSDFDARAPKKSDGILDRILSELRDSNPSRATSLKHVLVLKGGKSARQKFAYSSDTVAATLRDWGFEVASSTVKGWRTANVD